MTSDNEIYQYLVVKPDKALRNANNRNRANEVESIIQKWLREIGLPLPVDGAFRVTALPSRWQVVDREVKGSDKSEVPTLNISLAFTSEEILRKYREVLNEPQTASRFLGIGADVLLESTDSWCPSEAADPIFGDRRDAHAYIRLDVLEREGLTGRGVNVVIVDRALDPSRIRNFGGGWRHVTADTTVVPTPENHAMMIARNVESIAPDATIWECAILPERITDIQQFVGYAHGAYDRMLLDIARWRQNGTRTGPWVFVNAWAIYNRKYEFPLGDYTANPNHFFNQVMNRVVAEKIDVVFAAGNCGQFCPKNRCGLTDRGPGRSIWGANSHPQVLTTGAVRTDGLWLGYSSQGDGNLHKHKPDLCVPSQFAEGYDRHLVNTGTSASCAIAGGVIAALRSRPGWDAYTISPSDLRGYLIAHARKTGGLKTWDRRLGNGILDVELAYAAIKQDYP